MSYDSGEELHSISNQREHETVVKATKTGPLNLCWKKLDRKSKKLSFNFQISDTTFTTGADKNTLESLQRELKTLQDKLESVSRNVYF